MSREQWDALVDANEAHALTLTLAQRNTIAETAAYLEAIEGQNDQLRAETARLEKELQEERDAFCELRELVEEAVTLWGDSEEACSFDAEMMALDTWLADTLRNTLQEARSVSVRPTPAREGQGHKNRTKD